MKRKLKKRITAFLLCMVLVVCNSVSILADEPVATAVESAETKEQEKATKEEKAPEATTAAKERTTEKAPETTTAKKEETTTEKAPEATTAKKEEKTTEKAPETTTAKKEETTTEKAPEATTAKKEETTTEKALETTTEKTDNTEASTATEKETAPMELIYENDQVTVKVSAISEGAIPAGATLKVVPIEKENSQTKTAYQEVEKKIQEKATQEKYDIAGFLAYDITLMDKDGKEVEPNSEVKVTMDYKQAAIPAETDIAEDEKVDVTVFHLEEDEAGNVKKVVDMDKAGKIDSLQTTDSHKIEKVELKTSSFSYYTIFWYIGDQNKASVQVHYVDEEGNSLDEYVVTGDGTFDINSKEYGEEKELILRDSKYQAEIPGYTYKHAKVATSIQNLSGKSEIEKIRLKKVFIKYSLQYYNDKHEWTAFEAEEKIYMIYKKESSSGGSASGGSSATGNLAHQKYVTKKADGTYDLTLNVTGATGTESNPAKVDVVFVLDISGSMDGTNIKNAKDAVNTLTTNLANNQTVDSKWKLVTFESSASIQTGWLSAKAINNTVQRYDDGACKGGTNYQAGLTKAGIAINSGRQDANKIVIFLTDGEPTYHGVDDEGGGNETEKDDYEGALTGAETISCNSFYAIGMGLPDKVYNKGTKKDPNWISGLDLLKEVAQKVHADSWEAQNVEENEDLSGVFGQISGSITNYTASNVHITDTLTSEVDPVESNPKPVVNVIDSNGQDATASEVETGKLRAVYDSETHTLSLNFDPAYELKKDYTYSVTLPIKTNEQAIYLYQEHDYQYPHTGEADTGSTSANQPGIFSNVENSAKVTWTTNGENKEGAYNRPVVQIPEEDLPVKKKMEPVNFYLNLSSAIMDTNGQITIQDKGNFTRCVSGVRSAEQSATGTGVPINADLKVIVPDTHEHQEHYGWIYPVIGSDTNTSALQADQEIRKLKEGRNGVVSGTEDEHYQIVNDKGEGAFPTDEEIFTYIQEQWNSGDYSVNKGKDITVNGVAINKVNLTTNNFTIRWYVFKDQDDFWHIDGILVPKGGILTVTKTFPNKVIADDVKDTFFIEVQGNFLTGDDKPATISKNLAQAEELPINEDGSVTYSWQFAIFDTKYTVSESEYATTEINWSYDSTDWSYTNSGGEPTKGKGTSKSIVTEISEEDTKPVTQTFAFHNHYNASLNLKKVSAATGNPEISGAKFHLSEKSETGWTELKEIVVNKDNTAAELNNLQTGKVYKLQEVEAPDAHVLLREGIYFIVEASGEIELCNEEGEPLDESDVPTMWWLDGTRTELTIKNEMLYELPSTGGNGIYWYTIGGMALMMGAALILYKDKRKRMVLLKR